MLIEFSVGNYLSFKDTVTLSMVAGDSVTRFEEDNVIQADKYRLLKSVAIYGANASGKTNLLKAMEFMRYFIKNSSKNTQANEEIPIEPFRLSIDTEDKPAFFEIIFLINATVYRYGFEVTKRQVETEWLFVTKKATESALFIRERDKIEIKRGFNEGKNLEDKTRDNALFLSVVAQFNGKTAIAILIWFEILRIMSGLEDEKYKIDTIFFSNFSNLQEKIKSLMNYADLGIKDISIPHIDTEEILGSR